MKTLKNCPMTISFILPFGRPATKTALMKWVIIIFMATWRLGKLHPSHVSFMAKTTAMLSFRPHCEILENKHPFKLTTLMLQFSQSFFELDVIEYMTVKSLLLLNSGSIFKESFVFSISSFTLSSFRTVSSHWAYVTGNSVWQNLPIDCEKSRTSSFPHSVWRDLPPKEHFLARDTP